MTKLAVVIALLSAACIATPDGGVRVVGTSGPRPAYGPPSPAYATAPGYDDGARAPGEDRHWFSADDYLISEKPDAGKPLQDLVAAKMIQAPAAPGEAARFVDAAGRSVTTDAYWRTHVADPRELALGARVFCPATYWNIGGLAHVPTRKAEGRGRHWILAEISDVARASSGWVTVGTVACDVRAVRTVVR